MRTLLNLGFFQCIWLVTVFAPASGRFWPGALALAASIAVQAAPRVPVRLPSLWLLAGSAAIGFAVDSALVLADCIRFPESGRAGWPPPAWMSVLWINFGTTLDESLAWAGDRRVAAALAGAAGGPLAYLAGQRGGSDPVGPPSHILAGPGLPVGDRVPGSRGPGPGAPQPERPNLPDGAGREDVMSAIAIWLAGWAVAALAMAIVWLVQRRTGRADRVDLAWTLGTGLLAASFALASDGDATRRALIATLASLWSLRLAWHLASRLRRSPEDGRYLRLRIRHGDSADTWLFWFFQVQALLCAFFAAPALIAARNAGPVGWPEALGVLVWAVAVAGETVADRQLSRFRGARPDSASVCRVGLWKYSRHPNYFFEWLHWWSYVCVGWQAPHGWLTLAGPVAMLLLILKVTGIPPTEEQALARRGEAYRRYQREVSAFFPWKPQGGFPVTASVVSIALAAAERGALPDTAIRFGIRRLCAARLRQEARRMRPSRQTRELAQALVAPVPEAANRQHYEVPAGVLRESSRPFAQVQLLLLGTAGQHAGGGRDRSPPNHLRPC